MKTINDIVTTGVEALSTRSTAAEAAAVMRNANIGAIPVIDPEKNTISGIVTDRDIVLRVVAEGKDPNSIRSGEIMTKGILTCKSDQSLQEAGTIMEKNKVRRLVVLSPDSDRVAGIVSLGDIALNSETPFAGEVIQEISKAS